MIFETIIISFPLIFFTIIILAICNYNKKKIYTKVKKQEVITNHKSELISVVSYNGLSVYTIDVKPYNHF
jgi:hypothetical protein